MPVVLTDNYLSRAEDWSVTPSAATDFPESALIDFRFDTSYKPSTTATIVVSIYAAMTVNVVAIDAKYAAPSATVTIKKGGTQQAQFTGIVQGWNLYQFSNVITTTQVLSVEISSGSGREIRHLWVGQSRTVKDPVYEFDPSQEQQERRSLISRSGIIVANEVLSVHRVLQATWNNVQGTDKITLQALKEECWDKGLPFVFFYNPTSDPNHGGLYWFEQDGFNFPFMIATEKTVAVRAIANADIETTVDVLPSNAP